MKIVIAIVVSAIWTGVDLWAQDTNETAMFVSVHGGAFWSTSGTHGEFYGKRAHAALGAGIGYRSSRFITTFASVTYFPGVHRARPYPFEIDPPPYRYVILEQQREIQLWLASIGVEIRVLSVDRFSIAGTVGAVLGLSTEETVNPIGNEDSNTIGVPGLLLGATANAPIDGTPLAAFVAGHYRYAPSLNSIQSDDNSGIGLLIGLRCDI